MSPAQIAALRAARDGRSPWQAARAVYVEDARRGLRRRGTTSRSASTTIGGLVRLGLLAWGEEPNHDDWQITPEGRAVLDALPPAPGGESSATTETRGERDHD